MHRAHELGFNDTVTVYNTVSPLHADELGSK